VSAVATERHSLRRIAKPAPKERPSIDGSTIIRKASVVRDVAAARPEDMGLAAIRAAKRLLGKRETFLYRVPQMRLSIIAKRQTCTDLCILRNSLILLSAKRQTYL
jgi:hypothetical protein